MYNRSRYDAVVIGGGFFGVTIADHLLTKGSIKRVALLEQGLSLFSRASYYNQARVHGGYHYPRSFITAYRSRVNLGRFVSHWPNAVFKEFESIYAVGAQRSKVTAKQFTAFCNEVGAELRPVSSDLKSLFNRRLVEAAFVAREYCFDANKLKQWAIARLEEKEVDLRLGAVALQCSSRSQSDVGLLVRSQATGEVEEITSRFVFNCTYSGINQIAGCAPTKVGLKHELAEICLFRPPQELARLGVTLVDGPFFSFLPFPAEQVSSLSHVAYTPHLEFEDRVGKNPYDLLTVNSEPSYYDRMIRDASRFIPSISRSEFVRSFFEVKTVLTRFEGDDSRPILFERNETVPNFFSILGGKIDNVFDVMDRLDQEIA